MKKLVLVVLSSLVSIFLFCQEELTITEIMYNSPGEDLEFIEFYNPSSSAIDLQEYTMATGVNYIFPTINLEPEGTFVITNDSLKFQRFYGQSAYQWISGTLNNGGELISVVKSMQDTVIAFTYNDNQPWSQMADGGGSSLTRCDVANDINLPESWERSTILVRDEEGTPVFGDPNSYTGCSLGGQTTLSPSTTELFVYEEEGEIEILYYLDNAPDTTTLFEVLLYSPSTAEVGLDYKVITDTLEFNSNKNSDQTLELEILEDDLEEDVEFFQLTLRPLNSTIFTESTRVNIISCNEQQAPAKLKLRGVIHSSQIKAIELIVLEEITREESRTYSIGSANNGGGTNGSEFMLDTEAQTGACLFVTNDTIRFKEFFGTTDNMQLIQDEELEADYNGNDAIELFQSCNLIDTYGEADVNGEGTVWDYDKGWAKRIAQNEDSLPSSFNPNDWIFSGKDNLDGDTNAESTNPYIIECIILDTEDLLDETNLLVYPNPSSGIINISSDFPIENLGIYNMQGQRIYYTHTLKGLSHQVDLKSELIAGTYMMRFNINGLTINKMIIYK